MRWFRELVRDVARQLPRRNLPLRVAEQAA